MGISERITTARKAKGITQTFIAEKLEMDRGNYSKLEKRGSKMTVEQLQSIADALGVSIGELLGIEQTPGGGEGEERVLVLEDRIKDKDFKLKAFERELYILKHLMIESLGNAAIDFNEPSDYVSLIEENPWLLILISGVSFNKIQIEDKKWKDWYKAASKYVKMVTDEMNATEDPFQLEREVQLCESGFTLSGDKPEDFDEFVEWSNDPKNGYEWIPYFLPMSPPKKKD